MVDWYMKGASNYDDSSYYMWFYMDHNGFADGDYGTRVMETHGEPSDAFMAYGVDTEGWTYGLQQVEIGLLESHRIRINSSGVRIWTAGDVWEDPLSGGGENLGDHTPGLFWATYNFKDDGDNIEGWTLSETGGTINVIDEFDGHKKVVEMNDTNTSFIVSMSNTFSVETDAIIELYIAIDDITTNGGFMVRLLEGASERISIRIDDDDIEAYYTGWWYGVKTNFITINTFIHIKFELDDSANTYSLFINGEEFTSIPYQSNSTTGITEIFMETSSSETPKVYVDAVGYSFDPYYIVGDNYTPLINSSGINLQPTQVITSADENLEFLFGKIRLDDYTYGDTWVGFGHRALSGAGNYGILFKNDGETWLHASTGKKISFGINDVAKMIIDASTLTMSVPIAMGSNKITGLTAGSASGEAVEYDQLHTKYLDSEAVAAVNAAGISLATTKVITSINENTIHNLGRATLGAGADFLTLGYRGATLFQHMAIFQSSARKTTINSGSGQDLDFAIGNSVKWTIDSNGDLIPEGANTYDIGNTDNEVASLWYCDPQDTTCADLSHYSIETLYSLFANIQPMKDGGLHYSKSSKQAFPHIDFKTLPTEFATPAPKDMTKRNVWERDKNGEIVKRKVHYKKGDIISIDAGTYQYALGNLVVKQYEKIKELETRIEVLENK